VINPAEPPTIARVGGSRLRLPPKARRPSGQHAQRGRAQGRVIRNLHEDPLQDCPRDSTLSELLFLAHDGGGSLRPRKAGHAKPLPRKQGDEADPARPPKATHATQQGGGKATDEGPSGRFDGGWPIVAGVIWNDMKHQHTDPPQKLPSMCCVEHQLAVWHRFPFRDSNCPP